MQTWGHGPAGSPIDSTPFEGTLNQLCRVHPQLARQRPVITLANEDHDLARAQAEGITPERVLELYAAYGHAVV